MSDNAAERWRRVTELFHEALEQPGDARSAYLDAASGGDPELRREVATLLAAHEEAGDRFEAPAAAREELDALARAVPLQERQIGPYKLERVLGEGGTGIVYLAEDTRLMRRVALKALAPRFLDDPVRRERLWREARAAAALNHPGIATVYSIEQIDGQVYVVSEYVAGETLRDELARGPLGPARARTTGIAIARALAAAHDAGIVHRDLKPENVARTRDGGIKILDFGLAAGVPDASAGAVSLTADGAAIGTPAYMAPEQIRAGVVDARADLFALGIIIFELATGSRPFRGDTPASAIAGILEDEPKRLVRSSAIPADDDAVLLDRVVAICLRKSPDERYQSAAELADALEGEPRLPSPPTPPPIPGQEPDASSRTLWWWAFHQGAATLAYLLLLIPLWAARLEPGPTVGRLLFLTGVVAVIVAGSLRLHLWFASRHYPQDWAVQFRQSRAWIRGADLLFSAVLAIAGLAAVRADAPAALLVAAAAAVAVSSIVVEPATTRAAFRHTRRI